MTEAPRHVTDAVGCMYLKDCSRRLVEKYQKAVGAGAAEK